MSHLRLYRLAFAPVLAALVLAAFSLDGVPEPVEPPPGTTEFDASSAAESARDILKLGPTRRPGSPTDDAAADLVRERFEAIVAGETAVQEVDATIDGEDLGLRNVTLTLPGASERTILIVASRDSRDGEGAPSSAAATGMLLELADNLAVASRDHTIVLASTSGGSAEAQGARALVDALPDRLVVDAGVVIYQPGFDEPFGPYLLGRGAGTSPPIGLRETTDALLADRSAADSDPVGVLGQVARLAIPVAVGEQAALVQEGVPALAISSAGELPLESARTVKDRLASDSLERFGPAVIAIVSALDTSLEPPSSGPGNYVRLGGNLLPDWSVAVLVLTLLLPPAALATSMLAGARRRGASARRGLAVAAEWLIPALAFVLALYLLAVVGVIPGSGVPYDPARFEIGAGEVLALVGLLALPAWLWWVLGLRRSALGDRVALVGAASGLIAVLGCLVAWFSNPYLALLLVPFTHLPAVLASTRWRPVRLAIPAALVAAVPLVGAVAYLASAFDWGAGTPWQLAVLAAGGGIPIAQVLATLVVLSAAAAIVYSSLGLGAARSKAGGETPDAA